MSGILAGIDVPDRIVRDVNDSIAGVTGTKTISMVERQSMGLDFFIHNTGSATLTVSRDGQAAKTVYSGDVYRWNDMKYDTVKIIATAVYEAQWAGLTFELLKRRGLMR